jgi:hypothetical protein
VSSAQSTLRIPSTTFRPAITHVVDEIQRLQDVNPVVKAGGHALGIAPGAEEYKYYADMGRSAVLCRAEGLALDLESLMPMVPREKRPIKP